MSELKAIRGGDIHDDVIFSYNSDSEDRSDVLYYLKSEADKMIAHQKYKRCLAKAERCKDKIENPVEYDEHDDWLIINEYWERWHKRWLKIAEKFKEAK